MLQSFPCAGSTCHSLNPLPLHATPIRHSRNILVLWGLIKLRDLSKALIKSVQYNHPFHDLKIAHFYLGGVGFFFLGGGVEVLFSAVNFSVFDFFFSLFLCIFSFVDIYFKPFMTVGKTNPNA